METVNPRLLNNLRKAFRIAQLDRGEVDTLVTELREVQSGTFETAAAPTHLQDPAKTTGNASDNDTDGAEAMIEPPPGRTPERAT